MQKVKIFVVLCIPEIFKILFPSCFEMYTDVSRNSSVLIYPSHSLVKHVSKKM